MSIYVTRYCPTCKRVIENYTRDYRAIGVPFVRCESCDQLIKYTHIFEWDTKQIFGKVTYLGIMLLTTILYSGALPLAYIFYAEFAEFKPSENTFIILFISGFIVTAIWSIYITVKDIKESRDRLKDKNYRRLIELLGFKIYRK